MSTFSPSGHFYTRDMEITEVTRTALRDELFNRFPIYGRLSELEFLQRLYDLNKLPSTDSRFDSALDDIAQHRVNNFDWDDDWIWSDPRLQLSSSDDRLLAFIAEMLHPIVRTDSNEASIMLSVINRLLAPDGYELRQVGLISGRAVYGARRRNPGPYIADASVTQVESDSYGDLWQEGHVRIFLSHISEERAFTGEVSEELMFGGMDGFVAHRDIEPDSEWQGEIERALMSCDVFVGLLHRGFSSRYWTQQEVGWALGRRIPVLMIHLGEAPVGFPGRVQAHRPGKNSPRAVASSIAKGLSVNPIFGPTIVKALVRSLAEASSYSEGREAAERLEEFGSLSNPVLDAIEAAYLENDQLYQHVAARVVSRILSAHGRQLPERN